MSELNMTLGEVRELIGEGVIFGHADFHCREIRSLAFAEEQDLAVVGSPDQLAAAEASAAGAFLVSEALGGLDGHQLIVEDPMAVFEELEKRARDASAGQPDPAHQVAP
ncbi:MAG: hypothetical protein ACE5GX_13105 [Thermoanaerobaculia bacterium]